MKPLPEIVADALVHWGLVPRPVTQSLAPERQRTNLAKMMRTDSASVYDPDEEYRGLEQPKFVPFDFKATNYEASGQLYEVSVSGTEYRLHRFDNRAELLAEMDAAEKTWNLVEGRYFQIDPPWKLKEANVERREATIEAVAQRELDRRLREGNINSASGFDSGDYQGGSSNSSDWNTASYGDGTTPNTSYIPLMGGPWAKQLYLHQYLDMHAKSFEAFNHNPLAKQLVNLTTYYTLGRGLDHRCSNFEADEVWREFLERTHFYEKLPDIVTSFWWSGELFIEFYDDAPKKGLTDFRTNDPSSIWDIITDPEDIEKVYYAHQQYSTATQVNYASNVGPTKQVDLQRYVIRHIPSDQYAQFKINVSPWEKRGRSDLFCILGWLKRLKDLMNARVVKGQLEAAFVWDITVATGDADVVLTQGNLPDPWKPGSTFIHNKQIELKPQTSSLKGGDARPDIDALLNFCAVGVGTPKELIGETGRGSSSSVLASTGPGVKRYETRQQLADRIVHTVADRVLRNAIAAGQLNADDILRDARTVKRLATRAEDEPDRDSVKGEMETAQQEAQEKADEQQQQQMDMQKQQLALGAPAPLVNVNRATPSKNGKAKEALADTQDTAPLNAKQKVRVKAIKDAGSYSRELLEFMFPPIAQEDRSAKLKDLALAEAMEWLPKSITGTLAAKELNITSYDFQDAWAMIVEEALSGMSIAHVYGQDGKHVPATVIAQDVQAEMAAKQPIVPQPMVNEPVPPPVAGDKLVPAAGSGGPPALNKPNTGNTKINNKSGPSGPANPTSNTDGHAAVSKDPMSNEGVGRIKKTREALRREMNRTIYEAVLKEAIAPVIGIRNELARYILSNPDAVKELDARVGELETSNKD